MIGFLETFAYAAGSPAWLRIPLRVYRTVTAIIALIAVILWFAGALIDDDKEAV